MFQINSPVLKSFLVLSCVFYFILLCLTAFGIAYSIKNSHELVTNDSRTDNYCKQVKIPGFISNENSRFEWKSYKNPLRDIVP